MPEYNTHRFIQSFCRGLLTASLAVALTGCFQNIAGTSGVSKKTSQSNFNDSGGGGTIDGAFNGTEILASTALGGIVGSYASSDSTLTTPKYGVMINLRIPLVNAIGEDVLTDLLNRVDTEAAVQNISVTLLVPQFGFKMAFKFSKVAFGNQKKLRNAMSVRPDLAGVDLSTGYLPDTAPVLQQASGYVFTYGGIGSDGSILARLTILYRDSLNGATGFLPNISNTSWGVGFPDNSSPQANATFTPLTSNLGKIFNSLYTSPKDGSWAGDADFKDVGVNPSKYMLAIHKDSAGAISQAWIINPIVAAPKGVLLCSALRNDLEYRVPDLDSGTSPTYYYVGDKAACDCHTTETEAGVITNVSSIFDPCALPSVDGSGNPVLNTRGNTATNKSAFLNQAISQRIPTPASGSFAPKTATYGGIVITSPL